MMSAASSWEAIGLSVVVPCYNEADGISELLHRVSAVCRQNFPDDYEIVLVNDGSSDHTWATISDSAASDGRIIGINLARNYGHQLALTAGLQHCRGLHILILDADLQDPPELLPDMFALLQQGHDVVYGQRIARRGESLFKRVSASLFYRTMSKMVDVSIPRDTGDFRLMTRRVLDHLNAMPERYRFIRGMISWLGFSQVAFHYERKPRFAGTSHYPLRKMLAFAIDAVTSFSVMPLRFASHLGIACGLAAFAALGWVTHSYMTSGTVAGWTSMMALILILGSIQLLMLGVFGEYLGRMYVETKRRPLYLVRDIVRQPVPSGNTVHSMAERLERSLQIESRSA